MIDDRTYVGIITRIGKDTLQPETPFEVVQEDKVIVHIGGVRHVVPQDITLGFLFPDSEEQTTQKMAVLLKNWEDYYYNPNK